MPFPSLRVPQTVGLDVRTSGAGPSLSRPFALVYNKGPESEHQQRRDSMAQLKIPIDAQRFSKGLSWKDYMSQMGDTMCSPNHACICLRKTSESSNRQSTR